MTDKDMPSKTALDLAVKPAGYLDWAHFARNYSVNTAARALALAYAEHLDKADKVGRVAERDLSFPVAVRNIARSLILPDPIDPDLLEAQSMYRDLDEQTIYLHGVRRGRELAKERDDD